MTRTITRLKKPLRRIVTIAGVEFVVHLSVNGALSARALGHARTHERHLADVFPKLMLEHGLVPQGGGQLLGRSVAPVRIFDGRSSSDA